ncbi:peptidase T [Caproiciproducens galactitolivorans]|uniref:peptidase T n=1 Tax=Caproiciproducens galactitolivorans TaxID=642589 RepID=UPI00240A1F3F|nr:peptidase T [Caproiciproducens galactitolivorans]
MKAYERLLKYVTFDTTSDENAPEDRCPSTDNQKLLAKALVEEMKALGISDAEMDKDGYVYGTLPANCGEKTPVIGLIAHMDTSPSAKGADINARIVKNYDGGDILLNKERNIVLSPAEFGSLVDYKGKDLIVTDGTTLLGADDKAGIAEILTAVEQLQNSGIKHGKIAVAFTPDEEIGRGADRFDVKRFGADFAYTVDGGKLGEIEYENFNAASAVVTVNGVNIHPGDAKNRMKNAQLMAIEFNSMLPPNEIPSCTEGYEGFHHLCHMEGDEEKAVLHYIIRDHDMDKFTEKKARFEKIAVYLNEKYGKNTVELNLKDSYYNMKEKISLHMHIIDRVKKAMRDAGVEPEIVPIRGGTDGARLSFMGLPCPNLSTGGHNFHGRFEYIPVQAMDSMVEVIINILKAF